MAVTDNFQSESYNFVDRILADTGIPHRLFGWPSAHEFGMEFGPVPSVSCSYTPPGWIIPDHEIDHAIWALRAAGLRPCPHGRECPAVCSPWLPPTDVDHFHRTEGDMQALPQHPQLLRVIRLYRKSEYLWYTGL
ncbi:hypothetical protein BO99DRAFT_409161 [Aspergillus violaceofuscus CBS 115571]|uniref:Uncharacterized protein n=1 Tax=Aspergillus violaceofuscus (strain CBS 115571) TaxID=1450538 RepID=A0A2V5HGT6_ASPV1|nr:hypothetical protein BO99DRAFT_409161 [Aspergillus violaceofuscus CBS 115571]